MSADNGTKVFKAVIEFDAECDDDAMELMQTLENDCTEPTLSVKRIESQKGRLVIDYDKQ